MELKQKMIKALLVKVPNARPVYKCWDFSKMFINGKNQMVLWYNHKPMPGVETTSLFWEDMLNEKEDK